MELSHLIVFNLTLIVAILSPGPAMLIALRATLSGGRLTGMVTGMGLAVMAATWTTLALLGLDGIFAVFPWAYVTLKTLGALYLIWIAYQTWKGAQQTLQDLTTPPHQRAFLNGLLANLANPKSVLFASAVLLVIFPRDITLADKALVVLNHLCVELLFYTGFALLLSTKRLKNGYLRLKPLFDRVAALVLGALGISLLLDRS